MASIQVRKETGCLIMDFYFQGFRCREQTALTDMAANRKKVQKVLDRIEADITAGIFELGSTMKSVTIAGALAQPFLVGATLDRIGLLDGKGLDLDQLAHDAHRFGPVAPGLGGAQSQAQRSDVTLAAGLEIGKALGSLVEAAILDGQLGLRHQAREAHLGVVSGRLGEPPTVTLVVAQRVGRAGRQQRRKAGRLAGFVGVGGLLQGLTVTAFDAQPDGIVDRLRRTLATLALAIALHRPRQRQRARHQPRQRVDGAETADQQQDQQVE